MSNYGAEMFLMPNKGVFNKRLQAVSNAQQKDI